jgi:hypothetical protein
VRSQRSNEWDLKITDGWSLEIEMTWPGFTDWPPGKWDKQDRFQKIRWGQVSTRPNLFEGTTPSTVYGIENQGRKSSATISKGNSCGFKSVKRFFGFSDFEFPSYNYSKGAMRGRALSVAPFCSPNHWLLTPQVYLLFLSYKFKFPTLNRPASGTHFKYRHSSQLLLIQSRYWGSRPLRTTSIIASAICKQTVGRGKFASPQFKFIYGLRTLCRFP